MNFSLTRRGAIIWHAGASSVEMKGEAFRIASGNCAIPASVGEAERSGISVEQWRVSQDLMK